MRGAVGLSRGRGSCIVLLISAAVLSGVCLRESHPTQTPQNANTYPHARTEDELPRACRGVDALTERLEGHAALQLDVELDGRDAVHGASHLFLGVCG